MSLRSAGGHPSAAPDTISARKVRGNRGGRLESPPGRPRLFLEIVRLLSAQPSCPAKTIAVDVRLHDDRWHPGPRRIGRRSPGQARGFTTSVRHRRGIRPGAVNTCTPRAPLRRRDHIEVLSPDLVELPSTVIHNPAADLAFRDEPASKTAGIEITDRHLLASDHCRKLVETIRLPRVAPPLRVQVDRSPHPTARRRSGDTDQVRRHLGWNVFPPLYVFAHLPPSTDPVISVDDLATRSQIGQPGCRSLARAEGGEVRRADVHRDSTTGVGQISRGERWLEPPLTEALRQTQRAELWSPFEPKIEQTGIPQSRDPLEGTFLGGCIFSGRAAGRVAAES